MSKIRRIRNTVYIILVVVFITSICPVAADTITLNDETCNSFMHGVWADSTCKTNLTITIKSGDTLEIESGITLHTMEPIYDSDYGFLNNYGAINNNGTIKVYSISNGGTFNNEIGGEVSGEVGQISNEAGGTFINRGSLRWIHFYNHGVFDNYGSCNPYFDIDNDGIINNHGYINSEGIINRGTFNNEIGGGVYGLGFMNEAEGTFINRGGFYAESGFQNHGVVFDNYGHFDTHRPSNNYATINNYGSMIIDNAQMWNSGIINDYGSFDVFDGYFGNSGTFIEEGTFNLIWGSLVNSGFFINKGTIKPLGWPHIRNSNLFKNVCGGTIENFPFDFTGNAIIEAECTPTTNIELSGSFGNNNWYVSNVQVTLTPFDNEGSGIAKTEYSLDGISWIQYSNLFTVSNEGTTIIFYKSTDNAGNVETTKTQEIKIDKTIPSITISSPEAKDYLQSGSLTLNFGATDTISGIDSITSSLDSLTVNNGGVIDLSTLTMGQHTLTVNAIDKAGNTATKSVIFNIKVISATVDIQPDTLNKASQDGTVTAYIFIEIPGYNVNAIDISTVRLSTNNGIVSALISPTDVGDHNSNGIPDLMVKFDRQAVIGIVDVGDVVVTISGKISGEDFEGSDTIRVIDKSDEVPEFPTIALPILSVIGVIFMFQRGRGK